MSIPQIIYGRITAGIFTLNINTNRGHSLTLTKNRSRLDIRKHYVTNRVVQIWNSLPNSVATAQTVKTFEKHLDKYWKKHPMLFDFNLAYSTLTGSCTLTLSENDYTEPNIEDQSDLLRLEKH